MNTRLAAALFISLLGTAGCTYESLRMGQRFDCARMPQTEAERCYARTRDSREVYESRRRQLEDSLREDRADQATVDPRFENSLPDL